MLKLLLRVAPIVVAMFLVGFAALDVQAQPPGGGVNFYINGRLVHLDGGVRIIIDRFTPNIQLVSIRPTSGSTITIDPCDLTGITISSCDTPKVAGVRKSVESNVTITTFPNPTIGSLTISLQGTVNAAATIEVIDVSGRVVHHLMGPPVFTKNTHLVWDGRDASGHALPPGTYLLVVRAEGYVLATGKLVIQ